MCGRAALYSSPIPLAALFDAVADADLTGPNWSEGTPSWNIGPQSQLFGVSLESHQRDVALALCMADPRPVGRAIKWQSGRARETL